MLLALPATAFAHLHLKRSDPASGARLRTAPAAIRLWFTDPPELAVTAVKVIGPAGETIPTSALRVDATDRSGVVAALTGRRPLGTYTVNWRGAGADGHPMRGHFRFVVDTSVHGPRP